MTIAPNAPHGSADSDPANEACSQARIMESENTSPPSEVFPRISCRGSHDRSRSEEVAEVSPGISCDSQIGVVTQEQATNFNSIAAQHRVALKSIDFEVVDGSDLTNNNLDAIASALFSRHEIGVLIENSIGHVLYQREDLRLAEAFASELNPCNQKTLDALNNDAMPLTVLCCHESANVFVDAFESALESLAEIHSEDIAENRADALSHA